MTTVATTHYTTVKNVTDFENLFFTITAEAVGTGNSILTTFALANKFVIPDSITVKLAGVVTTAYTLDADAGTITFNSAPGVVAITADYYWSDVAPSAIANYILRAEAYVNQVVGRAFGTATTVTEFLDGIADNDINPFYYSGSFFTGSYANFIKLAQEFQWDKTILVSNFPILSVRLVALNVFSDVSYSGQNEDTPLITAAGYTANIAFGSTTFVAQTFEAGRSEPLVKISLMLKYVTGTASTLRLRLYTQDPDFGSAGTLLATAESVAAFSSTDYQYYDFIFNTPYVLTATTSYVLVLDSSGSGNVGTYSWGAGNAGYQTGSGTFPIQIQQSSNSGTTWGFTATGYYHIFTTYTASLIVDRKNYNVYSQPGYIVLSNGVNSSNQTTTTSTAGLIDNRGTQNVMVNYTYGYTAIPGVVEQITTKLAVIDVIESRLMGSQTSMSVPAGNIEFIRKDVEMQLDALGRRLELNLI